MSFPLTLSSGFLNCRHVKQPPTKTSSAATSAAIHHHGRTINGRTITALAPRTVPNPYARQSITTLPRLCRSARSLLTRTIHSAGDLLGKGKGLAVASVTHSLQQADRLPGGKTIVTALGTLWYLLPEVQAFDFSRQNLSFDGGESQEQFNASDNDYNSNYFGHSLDAVPMALLGSIVIVAGCSAFCRIAYQLGLSESLAVSSSSMSEPSEQNSQQNSQQRYSQFHQAPLQPSHDQVATLLIDTDSAESILQSPPSYDSTLQPPPPSYESLPRPPSYEEVVNKQQASVGNNLDWDETIV